MSRTYLLALLAVSLATTPLLGSATAENDISRIEGVGDFEWAGGNGSSAKRVTLPTQVLIIIQGDVARVQLTTTGGDADCTFTDGGPATGTLEFLNYGPVPCGSVGFGYEVLVAGCRGTAYASGATLEPQNSVSADGSFEGTCT